MAISLDRALDRPINSTDLYFAHFLGAKGATRFLKATDSYPTAAAASLFPREAAANRSIFYKKTGEPRTLEQIYALMARKIEGAKGQGSGGTAMDAPLQLADASDAVRLVDVPASSAAREGSTMLALADRRETYLRPQPKNARLAYLLIASGGVI